MWRPFPAPPDLPAPPAAAPDPEAADSTDQREGDKRKREGALDVVFNGPPRCCQFDISAKYF